jgi:hypothetical protein
MDPSHTHTVMITPCGACLPDPWALSLCCLVPPLFADEIPCSDPPGQTPHKYPPYPFLHTTTHHSTPTTIHTKCTQITLPSSTSDTQNTRGEGRERERERERARERESIESKRECVLVFERERERETRNESERLREEAKKSEERRGVCVTHLWASFK